MALSEEEQPLLQASSASLEDIESEPQEILSQEITTEHTVLLSPQGSSSSLVTNNYRHSFWCIMSPLAFVFFNLILIAPSFFIHSPIGTNIPIDSHHFNATQTLENLKRFLDLSVNRHFNTDNNAITRNELLDQLGALKIIADSNGLELSYEESPPDWDFTNNYIAGEAIYWDLNSIIVSLGPKDPQPSKLSYILLSAHYDTTQIAPGAFDNGISFAVAIQILRHCSNFKGFKWQHKLMILFDNAEECGLWGARDFKRWYKKKWNIDALINLDAGGTLGRAIIFQANSYGLVGSYLKHSPYPYASVLAQDIFSTRIIPSGTNYDLLHTDLPAISIAFFEGHQYYHTRKDSFDKVKPFAVQHLGDNLMSALTHLLSTNTTFLHNERSLFLHVYDKGSICWTKKVATAFTAIAAGVGLALWCMLFVKNRKHSINLSIKQIVAVFGQTIGSFVLSLIIAATVSALIGSGPIYRFPISMPIIALASALLSFFLPDGIAWLFTRYCCKSKLSLRGKMSMANRIVAVGFIWQLGLFLSLIFAALGYLSFYPIIFAAVFYIIGTALFFMAKKFLASWSGLRYSDYMLVTFVQIPQCVFVMEILITIFGGFLPLLAEGLAGWMLVCIFTAIMFIFVVNFSLLINGKLMRKAKQIMASLLFVILLLTVLVLITMPASMHTKDQFPFKVIYQENNTPSSKTTNIVLKAAPAAMGMLSLMNFNSLGLKILSTNSTHISLEGPLKEEITDEHKRSFIMDIEFTDCPVLSIWNGFTRSADSTIKKISIRSQSKTFDAYAVGICKFILTVHKDDLHLMKQYFIPIERMLPQGILMFTRTTGTAKYRFQAMLVGSELTLE